MTSYHWPPKHANHAVAVLCSGGLDSAILLGEALRVYPAVTPLYVRVGTVWEATELTYLERFLNAMQCSTLQPLTVLQQPCDDLYGGHWSMNGRGTPRAGDPEEDSYLPGRNALLFVKPLLWCLSRSIETLLTAPLASNPFPDATPDFYDGLANVIGMGVNGVIRIERPYAQMGLHKEDVLRRGIAMPLQSTFSCIRPDRGLHCGHCSKCGERQQGFHAAAMTDPTIYANPG